MCPLKLSLCAVGPRCLSACLRVRDLGRLVLELLPRCGEADCGTQGKAEGPADGPVCCSHYLELRGL